MIATVKKIQELRGLINRWHHENGFLHYAASQVGGLTSFGGSAETWIRSGNDQVRLAFWNSIAFARPIGEQDGEWGDLFSGLRGRSYRRPIE